MKHKVNLEEIPQEIKDFRVKAQARIQSADLSLDRMKVFAECWHEEQELWRKAYPERAAEFQKQMEAEVINLKTARP